MYQTLIPLSALFFGIVLLLTGLGLQGTLLPVRATFENFAPIEIGVLGSSYFIGFVAGSLRTSYLVQAVGHIRVFAALVVMISAVPLLHALAVHPLVWWILRAITGFCMAGVYLVIESWLNERSTNATRGTILGTYTSISLGAIALGQLLLPLYDPTDFHLFAVASVLVSLAAVPVALTRSAGPAQITQVSFRFMRLLTISPVGVAGCVAFGLTTSAFWTIGPAYGLGIGLDVSQVALFMSVVVLGGAVGQWPFGYVSDRTDRRWIIILSASLAGLAALALLAAGYYWPAGVLIFAFVFGAAAFPIYAVSVSYVNDLIEPGDFVETSSGLLLVLGIASTLGPIIGAMVMQWAGPSSLFLYMAFVLLLMAGFTYSRMRSRGMEPVPHTASFVPVTGSVATVTTLDPRAEDGESGEPDNSV